MTEKKLSQEAKEETNKEIIDTNDSNSKTKKKKVSKVSLIILGILICILMVGIGILIGSSVNINNKDIVSKLGNKELKDIEIVVVNDGATDNSPKIIEEYAKKEPRIKVVNQENSGLSAARNSGIKTSTAEFITFLDSDDWLDEDFVEKLYNAAINNNADIAVGGMKRQREKSFKYRLNFKEEKVYSDLQEKLDICRIPDCCYACGKLFKRELIQNRPFKKGFKGLYP